MAKQTKADFRYRITTTVDADDAIQQTLEDQAGAVTRWATQTRDAHVREALIALGWTPPEEPTVAAVATMRDKDWSHLMR